MHFKNLTPEELNLAYVVWVLIIAALAGFVWIVTGDYEKKDDE